MKETKLNVFILPSQPRVLAFAAGTNTGLQLLMQLVLRNESQCPRRGNVYWCVITIFFLFFKSLCSSCWHNQPKSAGFKKEVMIFCQQDTRRGQYLEFLQASKSRTCSSSVLVWSSNHAALSQLMLRNTFHHLLWRKTIILCHQIESVSCFISHLCLEQRLLFFFILHHSDSSDTIKRCCLLFDAQQMTC